MKKILIAIAVLFFMGACNSEQTPSEIKNQIFEYKEKIAELEKILNSYTTQAGEDDGSVRVRIWEAQIEEVKHTFSVTGAAEAQEIAYISPETNGQIKNIYVTEGQFVRKGALLISLNADIIKSSLQEIKTGLDFAKVMLEKQENLRNQNVGKEVDYLQAKNQKESLEGKYNTLQAQLRMSEIRAPFDGIVDEIYGKPGELAMPGKQIIQFVNLNKLKITVAVSEKYLPFIKKGDKVTVSFPSFPDLKIETVVGRIGNVINPANRTFAVEVFMTNPDNKIKPNMIAEIILSDYEGKNIMVPSIIVKTDRTGEYVYVAKNNNSMFSAKKVYVKTSYVIGNKIVLKSGINPGDKVIVDGYSIVKNRSKLDIIQ